MGILLSPYHERIHMNAAKIGTWLSKNWWIALLLIVTAVAPYANSLGNQFAYDDPYYFVHWDGIRQLNIPDFFAGDQPANYHHVYRPIRSVLLALVYQVGHMQPLAYHIFAIAVNLLAVIFVYLVAKKITNKTITKKFKLKTLAG